MRSYNKAGEPLKDTTATPALGLTRDIGTSQKLKENSYIKVYATIYTHRCARYRRAVGMLCSWYSRRLYNDQLLRRVTGTSAQKSWCARMAH